LKSQDQTEDSFVRDGEDSFSQISTLKQHESVGQDQDLIPQQQTRFFHNYCAKPNDCDVHVEEFTTLTDSKQHIGIHSLEDECQYSCNLCHEQFLYLYDLVNHIYTHTRVPHYACHVCKMQFVNEVHFTKHMRTHSGEKLFSCGICSRRFRQIRDLRDHIFRHAGIMPYSCTFCVKRFVTAVELMSHTRNHTDERPFACDICGSTFLHRSTLQSHMLKHSDGKGCPLCSIMYSTVSDLTQHFMSFHTSKTTVYLKRRMDMHRAKQKFVCYVCQRSFSQMSALKQHVSVHEDQDLMSQEQKQGHADYGESVHDCDVHDNNFQTVSDLKRHMDTHAAKQQFICFFCQQQFTQLCALQQHMSVHCEEHLNLQDETPHSFVCDHDYCLKI